MIKVRRFFAVLTASSALAASVGTPAALAQPTQQNGLVNVAVGDVAILNDVNIGVAAQFAAAVCGVNVGPVAVLAANVDATGVQRTVCTVAPGNVRITQA